MVKFTTLAAGGVDYYQADKPASAKDGELWLPYKTVTDPTQATGVTEKWTHTLHASGGRTSGVHASNGLVYSAGGFESNYKVIAADATDGSKVWEHTLHGNQIYTIDGSNGVVYSSENRDIYGVDAATGDKVFSKTSLPDTVKSLHASNGVLYVGLELGQIRGYDTDSGTELLSTDTNEDLESIHVSNGNIYIGHGDNGSNYSKKVRAISADDGSGLWTHSLHSDEVFDVYVSDGVVYSAGDDVQVNAANASDGSKIWKHQYHGNNVMTVYESNGVVYSGDTGDNQVIAVDSTNGSLIWKHNLHNDDVVDLSVLDDTVYSVGDAGKVVAAELDGATTTLPSNGTDTPQLYYNGEWLQSQNDGTTSTGGSY